MWQWLRRSFLAGVFLTVPLVLSVITVIWLFGLADRVTGGLGERFFGVHVPGLGIIVTAGAILLIGTLARNMLGRRILQTLERWFLYIPIFKTVYAPLKQLSAAFAPDNELGFKRVVMVERPGRGFVLGFLTREFVVEGPKGTMSMVAVYVPTNHLYLGDVLICRREDVSFPEITVEQGIRIFLTGGMALPTHFGAGGPDAERHLDKRGESAR